MTEHIAGFVSYLTEKNKSNNTIQSYARDLNMYAAYIEENGFTAQEGVKPYTQYLLEKGKTKATVSRFLSSLKCFSQYMEGLGYSPLNLDVGKPQNDTERTPDILSEDEIMMFFNIPDAATNKGRRDRAILQVLYATGMRVTDLLSLNMEDYDSKEQTIFLKTKKSVKIIPLYPLAAHTIDIYLSFLNEDSLQSQKPLFFNPSGERMTRQGMWKMLKGYCSQLNIKKDVTPNTFRNSLAYHMMENGVDVKDVRQMLGSSYILSINKDK